MSTRRPPDVNPEVVLRPRLSWRLVLPPAFVLSVLWLPELMEGPRGWKGPLVPLMLGLGAGSAWWGRVVVIGPTIYRRSMLGWRPSLNAGRIDEVRLGKRGRYRITDPWLTLTLSSSDGSSADFHFIWWGQATRLVGWLVRHCTRTEDGEMVWTVKTDETTRRRLESVAEPSPPRSDPFR